MSALDLIHSSYQELKSAKARIEHKQRQELEEKLSEIRKEFAILVARAVDDEEVKVAQICREMPTSSRNTAYAFLAEGREHRAEQPHLPQAPVEESYIRNDGAYGTFWSVPIEEGIWAEIIWDELEEQWVDNVTGGRIDPRIDINRFEGYLRDNEFDKS